MPTFNKLGAAIVLGSVILVGGGCAKTGQVVTDDKTAPAPAAADESKLAPTELYAARLTAAGLKFIQKDGTAQAAYIFSASDAARVKKATTFVVEIGTSKVSVMLFDYTGSPGSFTMSDSLSALGKKAKEKDPTIQTGFMSLDGKVPASAYYLYTGSSADFEKVQAVFEKAL